jgi:diphthine-ammonia ligase
MKVIALVSGGKDSTFNMMECVRMGHQIVALANLFPAGSEHADAPDEADELDSYCFQTVGHSVIAAYSQCMGVPLHRRAISAGASKNQDMVYDVTQNDEVEDLFQLLAEVKRLHPDANAVSSGAVLSDYQRLRVEHVCARLSLTSLAFMWRRPQKQLLRTMIDRGVEAIVIKIAAMGLKPHHLGQTVAALETTFCELEDQYGNHAAGEGGEYETLTLDCPLFTHRLVIDEARVVTVSADKFAPVAFQHITKFHVEQKAPRAEPEPESEPPSVATTWAPAPLDVVDWGTMQATANAQHFWRDKAEEWCNTAALEEQKAEGSCTHEYCSDFQAAIAASMQSEQFFLRAGSPRCPEIVIEAASGTSAMESLSVVASARKSEATGGKGIAELATKAMHSIQTQLESKGRKLEDVFFACIYLADLGDFAVFNGVYCKSFGVNAPSRYASVNPGSTSQVALGRLCSELYTLFCAVCLRCLCAASA